MKKIYTLVLAILLVGAFSANAQIKLGVKGGLNLPSLNAQNGAINFDSKTGWHGGAMVELKLPIIGIEGDFIYSQNSFEIPNIDKLKISTFDIPVVAKLYILKVLNIQAGPMFSFTTSANSDVIGDIKDQFDSKTFQFVAGLGAQLGPIDVHGRFIFPSTTKFTDAGTEYKNSVIQISAGIWLKK